MKAFLINWGSHVVSAGRLESRGRNCPPFHEIVCPIALWARIEKNHSINSHPIIHYPTSKEVSKVSERVSTQKRASKASSAEQANEWAVQANKRKNEQVA